MLLVLLCTRGSDPDVSGPELGAAHVLVVVFKGDHLVLFDLVQFNDALRQVCAVLYEFGVWCQDPWELLVFGVHWTQPVFLPVIGQQVAHLWW